MNKAKGRPFSNIPGKTFGQWSVLDQRKSVITLGGGHATSWLCRCSCGTEKYVNLSSLKNQSSISCRKCGDRRNGIARAMAHGFIEGKPRITNTYWYRIIQGAKSRGHEITITKEGALALFIEQKGKCALTGCSIYLPNRARAADTASLDRINNKLGYVTGNIQWLHWHINKMKGSFEQCDFITLCESVANYLGKSETPKTSERLDHAF